ncbi:hypothetical protein EJ06DRAFT_529348 [Trichodelitschia bisporula]|uniref:C2H2-type domain-containing protein n=1 Tax=Trichodelitschia bisporula TaxID=703511 RepID=A0A6G1HZF9_9PEZI|nr:hypothetical protein EJ06DRAFT_529348 [Trichodelitschia bisporula]
MDSPGSPLSEHLSDEFQEQEHVQLSPPSLSDVEADPENSRPSKRQRISGDTVTAWEPAIPPSPSDAEISPDTDGSVPGSPHWGADEDEPYGHHDQITICRWLGCEAGDLGNMDNLVDHLHEEHIQARQKKYTCEWGDCARRGVAHASGYALRAHMRSHTREKPFYCSLPECDRSFTRSDALAKHMRTVHETEALRPSDPVPKHHSSNPQNKTQRVRLTFKGVGSNGDASKELKTVSVPTSPVPEGGPEADYEQNNAVYVTDDGNTSHINTSGERRFPADVQFTEEELALPADQLFRLLRRQLAWVSQDAEDLRREVDELDARRKKEWKAKELLMDNVMEGEMARGEKMHPSLKGEPHRLGLAEEDMRVLRSRPIVGEPTPWWREEAAQPMDVDTGEADETEVAVGVAE